MTVDTRLCQCGHRFALHDPHGNKRDTWCTVAEVIGGVFTACSCRRFQEPTGD